jgi:pimeloyl-ACP methyl ester carboxylesterase
VGRLIRFGPARDQVVEASGPEDGPACVLLHGGFWRARYDRSLMDGLAADLAGRGWRALNAEYRRGGAPWRTTLDDVLAAIALAGHAPVFAVGHSAGGHLALLAAAQAPLAGIVSQAGVADLAEADRLGLGGGVTRHFAHGDPDADPIRLAPTGVPMLLVHGERDDIVPPSLSERYAKAAGAGAELDVRPGEGHFEHIDPASGAWARVVSWLEAHR